MHQHLCTQAHETPLMRTLQLQQMGAMVGPMEPALKNCDVPCTIQTVNHVPEHPLVLGAHQPHHSFIGA
jgi:hypothetical protein